MSTQRTPSSSSWGEEQLLEKFTSLPRKFSLFREILIPQRKCVFLHGESCYSKGKMHPSNECRLTPQHVHSPWQEVHAPAKKSASK